jgi:hypothetical protein
VLAKDMGGFNGFEVGPDGLLYGPLWFKGSVAENLPIGLEAGPGLPPPYVVTGVAVMADGTVVFSADRNNARYRVRPQR